MTNTATQDDAQETPQAQFFSQPVPLDMSRHGKAGLRQSSDASFARDSNSVVISLREIPEASRSYPIVFSNEETPKLIAILGADDHNSFIAPDGTWLPRHYVPLYVRKYPFGIARGQEEGTYALCVDEGAHHYMDVSPDLPFYEDGQPSAMCQQALEMCAAFQKQLENTEQFCLAVKEAGLLEEKQVQLQTTTGEQRSLGGFSLVNEEKWNDYAASHIAQWQTKGFAAPMALILASQHNWKYLV